MGFRPYILRLDISNTPLHSGQNAYLSPPCHHTQNHVPDTFFIMSHHCPKIKALPVAAHSGSRCPLHRPHFPASGPQPAWFCEDDSWPPGRQRSASCHQFTFP